MPRRSPQRPQPLRRCAVPHSSPARASQLPLPSTFFCALLPLRALRLPRLRPTLLHPNCHKLRPHPIPPNGVLVPTAR
jgi:hypothetical protein